MNESLFINIGGSRVVECAVYEKTNEFPNPTKYVSITTASGRRGYLPLDDVGNDYDSGLRFTEALTSVVHQVCTRVETNIVNTYIHLNNYFAVLTPTSTYDVLRAVFEDRVTTDGNYVYLRAPGNAAGVSKMLIAGDGVEVNYGDITYSLEANGGQQASPFTKSARAILVKFERGHVYRLRVTGRACAVIGQDVDSLPDFASGFTDIAVVENVCSLDASGHVSADDPVALANVNVAKGMLNSTKLYSYYVLTDEVYRSTAADVE